MILNILCHLQVLALIIRPAYCNIYPVLIQNCTTTSSSIRLPGQHSPHHMCCRHLRLLHGAPHMAHREDSGMRYSMLPICTHLSFHPSQIIPSLYIIHLPYTVLQYLYRIITFTRMCSQYGKTLLHTNPKEAFSPKYLDGLKDGMWFSSNTLLNGIVNPEKTVITGIGRFITTVGGWGIWVGAWRVDEWEIARWMGRLCLLLKSLAGGSLPIIKQTCHELWCHAVVDCVWHVHHGLHHLHPLVDLDHKPAGYTSGRIVSSMHFLWAEVLLGWALSGLELVRNRRNK